MQLSGFSLKEGIIATALVLAVVVLAWLGATDMSRRSRDTARLSTIRNIQADLEDFRRERASYPVTLELIPAAQKLAFQIKYEASPTGCAPDLEQLCRSYTLSFILEGKVGSLPGGNCSIEPQGLSCGQAEIVL